MRRDTASSNSDASRSYACVCPRSTASDRLRNGNVLWLLDLFKLLGAVELGRLIGLGELHGFFGHLRLFGRRLTVQYHVLNVRSIDVGLLSGFRQSERCYQPLR